MKSTFEEVVEFLKNYAEFYAGEVSESTQLIADLGLDSIRLIAIAEDSERKYNIFIEDDELMSIKTVGDIANVIEKHNSDKI